MTSNDDNNQHDNKILRLVPDPPSEEDEASLDTLPTYPPNYVNLKEISDRVMACQDIKEKFVHMYVSFDDLSDCNITDKGYNLYCEDDEYVYIYTVVKK